jgi:hypothetical protein
MTISGLEDEFNIAREVGLPRLAYVQKNDESRDPRLAELITRAKGELTISLYGEPAELNERLRDDITAEVARNFNAARQVAPLVEVNAAQFLDRLVPTAERLDRGDVRAHVEDALREHHILEVQGELGVGKTVIIATLAAKHDWVFLAAQRDSPLQVASRLANRLREKLGDSFVLVRSYEAAIAAVADAWRRCKGTTVAIDGCPSLQLLDDLTNATSGGPSSDYPLVFSTGSQADASVFPRVRVPSLSQDEVVRLWQMRFGSRPSADELSKLMGLSKGNPLYLRYVRTPVDVEITDSALESIELRRWRSLLPLAQDMVTYICMSAQPIPLDALITLTGEKDLMNALEQASVLTLDTADGFSPIHQHLRVTICRKSGGPPPATRTMRRVLENNLLMLAITSQRFSYSTPPACRTPAKLLRERLSMLRNKVISEV